MTNPALRLVGFLAVLFLVVGAAVALDSDEPRNQIGGGGRPSVALGDVRLVSAESCDDLVAFYREAAARSMSAMYTTTDVAVMEESTAAAGDATASSGATERDSAAPADGDAFSGTNLQERDVDEPDTVKTDGDVAVLVTYEGLHIVDVGADEPTLLSSVDLEQGATEILLAGDRVLALTTTYRAYREDPAATQQQGTASGRMTMPAGNEVTVLTTVDISDPSNPTVVETAELEGAYRTARATGSTARVVLVSYPQMPAPGPAVSDYEAWQAEAIEAMTFEDWAPDVPCEAVAHTSEPQGTSTTTVLTVDLEGTLAALDTDAVVADAGTVYASADRLYIATSQWAAGWETPKSEPRTELHAFDITDPASTSYVGSGAVDGFLLNQFSLSEHEGDLRVATTQQPPWDGSGTEQATSSSVAVLAEQDGALAEIGRVDGLGVTETIQAVRFMGDVAYVVTFRQTDPLYVIDLADPTAPRTAGELKIPGFSSYLHPIGDDRMVGVGQDADEQGTPLGTQVSTFDVSDMTSPQRIDNAVIENGQSAVQWDHRAFLWWADTRTVVVPVGVYDQDSGGGVVVDCPPDAICTAPVPAPQQGFVGAVAFGIDEEGGVEEAGRVSHMGRGAEGGWYSITRSFVVADSLYTVSEAGVLQSSLATFADEGFAPLPAPVYDDQPVPIEG